MKEYEFEDYYKYWIEMRNKPLIIGQKISVGLLDGKDEKLGIIFRIDGEQKPESVTELHFFYEDLGRGEDLRMGGNAFFDVIWQDGTITTIPERYLRNYVEVMLVPEIADTNEIEQALIKGFSL